MIFYDADARGYLGQEATEVGLFKGVMYTVRVSNSKDYKITFLASMAGAEVPRQGKRGKLSPGLAVFLMCIHQRV